MIGFVVFKVFSIVLFIYREKVIKYENEKKERNKFDRLKELKRSESRWEKFSNDIYGFR